MVNLNAYLQRFLVIWFVINELRYILIPLVDSGSADRIFANEEEFLLFWVEGTANQGIVEKFNIFILRVSDVTLVNHFLRN